MWNNLERRFGRFAIPRLMNYIIGGYAIGYLLYFMYRVTGLNYLAHLPAQDSETRSDYLLAFLLILES